MAAPPKCQFPVDKQPQENNHKIDGGQCRERPKWNAAAFLPPSAILLPIFARGCFIGTFCLPDQPIHFNWHFTYLTLSPGGIMLAMNRTSDASLPSPPWSSHQQPLVVSCTGNKAITDLPLTRLLFLLAYLCIFVVGTVGNLLVVWVVLNSKQKMQTVTNVFIANLALSDLLVCFTSIWLTPTYTYIGHWIWGSWLCYSLPLFQGASIFISSLSLTAIALDRYWVICLAPPHRNASQMHTSKQVCLAVICLIWCVSILLALPYAVHMRTAQVKWPCNFSLCVEDWLGREDLRSVYGVITALLQFALPFAIIGRSYRRIWRFLENRRLQLLRPISEAQMTRKRRLLRMLVRMVLVFGCCWLPFNLLSLSRDLRMDTWLKPYFSFLFLLAHLLSMVVPAANPILYAWMNSAFREAFMRVLPLGLRLRKKLELMELGTMALTASSARDEAAGRRMTEPAQNGRRTERISSTLSLRLSPISPLLIDKNARSRERRSREC